jgi:hypothetical protein
MWQGIGMLQEHIELNHNSIGKKVDAVQAVCINNPRDTLVMVPMLKHGESEVYRLDASVTMLLA